MRLRWRIAQFFEKYWWRRYLGKKDKQSYLEWKRSYWRHFLETCKLTVPDHSTVLDAGCGPAGIFISLAGQQVDALDPLLDFYEKTLPHFSRHDYPGVRFIARPLEHFQPGKQYDCVFCLNAINHVSRLDTAIDRLAALTKTGGTLTVSIDAHNFSFLKRLFRLVPADILHPHQHDLEEYSRFMTERSFELTRQVLVKKGLIFNYYVLSGTKKPSTGN